VNECDRIEVLNINFGNQQKLIYYRGEGTPFNTEEGTPFIIEETAETPFDPNRVIYQTDFAHIC
jgi:hypothetical protein